jgi:hypothetical protein
MIIKNKTRQLTLAFAWLLLLCRPGLSTDRSWVSQNGKDQNDCSQVHPCRTFQRAHDVTQAYGEVNVLDPADYGRVNVMKPITFDGGNMAYIHVPTQSDETAFTVNVSDVNSVVVIRNMSFGDPNFSLGNTCGVNWIGPGTLRMENVTVQRMDCVVFVVPRTQIFGGSEPTRSLVLKNVTSAKSSGIALGPPTSSNILLQLVPVSVTVEDSSFAGFAGTFGAALDMPYGRARVVRSMVTGMSIGINASGSSEINIENSTIADSDVGIAASAVGTDRGGSLVRIGADNIHNNGTAFKLTGGGQIVSFGNNHVAGNAAGESPTSTIVLK